MDIKMACDILTDLAQKRGTLTLELLGDYRNGCNENGFNPDYGLVENQALNLFIKQAQNFFAPVEA